MKVIKPNHIVVSSFMRSGTHLTIDFLRLNFPEYDLKRRFLGPLSDHYVSIDVLLENYQCPKRVKRNEARKLEHNAKSIIKSHFSGVFLNKLEEKYKPNNAAYIYVFRDPVKVISSLYIFQKSYMENSVFTDFNKWVCSKRVEWENHVRDHLFQDGIFVLSFDKLITSPEKVGIELDEKLSIGSCTRSFILPNKIGPRWRGWLARAYMLKSQSTEIGPRNNFYKIQPKEIEIIRKELECINPEIRERLVALGLQ